jgi:hypothetical protein
VEAGSNTSTVTLQVVGGDEKGSLESETVKYGHESKFVGVTFHKTKIFIVVDVRTSVFSVKMGQHVLSKYW